MSVKQFWENYRKMILSLIFVIAAGITIYFAFLRTATLTKALSKLVHILTPFIIGGILAYLVSPMCSIFEEWFCRRLSHIQKDERRAKRMAHSFASIAVLLVLIGGISGLLALLIPQLYQSMVKLGNSASTYGLEVYLRLQPAINWLEQNLDGFGFNANMTAADWMNTAQGYAQKLIESILNGGMANFATTVTKSVQSVLRFVLNLLVGIIVMLYCLNSRKAFSLQGKKLIYATFSRRWAEEILYRLRFANKAFLGFVSGRILDSFIIGCICFVGCSLMKITYAPLIAVIVGVTNVIPFFGPYIGAVPSFLLILLENPIQSLYFLIFILVLQQFDGNILGPRIIGSAVGVSGFWVLFSILFFGGLWGIVGMIVGTPLFAVIYDILRDWVNYRLEKKGLPQPAYYYGKPLDASAVAPDSTEAETTEN